MNGDSNEVELCFECDYIREWAPEGKRTGEYLCVCKHSFDKSVALATRACKYAVPTRKPIKQKQY